MLVPMTYRATKTHAKYTPVLLATLFFNSAPVLLKFFFLIKLQTLLRCCLMHITIMILRDILHLAQLCLYLDLGLFMLYYCDLFVIFSLIFVFTNHLTLLKQTHLFFVYLLEYILLFLNEKNKKIPNSKTLASGCCLAFVSLCANFSLTLLIKVLLIKKGYS